MEKMALMFLVLVLAGCSDSAGEDAAAAAASALSEDCVNVVTDGHFFDTDYTSPRTYSEPNCFKGVVGEVYEPGNGPFFMTAGWADDPPTTQESCESAWVGAYLFGRTPPDDFQTLGVISTQGTWTDDGFCAPPKVSFSIARPALDQYRLAASARTAGTSSAPTRIVRIRMPGVF